MLVVGGGSVAARKITLLVRAGASIRIMAPELAEGTRSLVESHQIEVLYRGYRPADLDGVRLVVSATDDEAVNQRIFNDAVARGLLVNTVDQPARSNVIFPSIVDRSPVLVAVSTGGSSIGMRY